jgi:hypothetical protein
VAGLGSALRRHLWLPLGILTLFSGGYVYFFAPHQRLIAGLTVLLFKLLPFFMGSLTIAALPDRIPGPRYLWSVLPVLALLGFIIPRLFYFAMQGFEASPSDSENLLALFDEFYTVVAILVPFIFLWVSLTFRLGGGSPSGSLKLSLACLLVMLSGYEDVMLFLTTPMGPLPETATWAHHVTVFLGHPPSRAELFGFMAIHFVLAVLVLTVPWGKSVTSLRQRLSRPVRKRDARAAKS